MRKNIFVLSLSLLFFIFPAFAHAAVVINEIAWMGTDTNSNAEWIELANTGDTSIDLTNWTITNSTASPWITISAKNGNTSIGANGYFLLERTSVNNISGITGDQVYTGALVDTGTTLTLSDSSGTAVDTVVGGLNWINVGGKKTVPKETAQRTANGTWITAAPTPDAANALITDISTDTASDDESSSASTTDTSATDDTGGGSSDSSSTLALAPATLVVTVGQDRTALIEVPLTLAASVKTKSGAADSSARVDWSFGDGSATEGSTAEKTYHYAGTYLAVAVATDGSTVARDDLIVTVKPAAVRIAAISGDGITLANDANERLDLSDWRLTAGTGSFRIPEGTTLLPNASALFPYAVTDLPVALDASLAYPDGIIAAQYDPLIHQIDAIVPASGAQLSASSTSSTTIPAAEPIIDTVNAQANIQKNNEAINDPATASPLAVAGAALASVSSTSSEDAEATETPATGLFHSPWFLGLLGVVAVAGGAFVIL